MEGLLAAALALQPASAAPALRTSEPAPGLVLRESARSQTPSIVLVEADPKRWELRLLSAAQLGLKANRNAREWAKNEGLALAVNAGMYQSDHKTSVGLLVADGKPNNRRLGRDKTVLAFGPKEKGLPPVQIVDRECQDFPALRDKYRSLLQGIRMLDCKGELVWQKGGKRWPMAVAGMTRKGKLLFAFARTDLTPREFAELLQGLAPLERLMYLEGGPPAQLYLKIGKTEVEATGASGEASVRDGTDPVRIAVPNVLGLIPKK